MMCDKVIVEPFYWRLTVLSLLCAPHVWVRRVYLVAPRVLHLTNETIQNHPAITGEGNRYDLSICNMGRSQKQFVRVHNTESQSPVLKTKSENILQKRFYGRACTLTNETIQNHPAITSEGNRYDLSICNMGRSQKQFVRVHNTEAQSPVLKTKSENILQKRFYRRACTWWLFLKEKGCLWTLLKQLLGNYRCRKKLEENISIGQSRLWSKRNSVPQLPWQHQMLQL